MEDCLPEIPKRKRISAENFGGVSLEVPFDGASRCSARAPSIRVLNTIMPLESGLVNMGRTTRVQREVCGNRYNAAKFRSGERP
jgi:hypothetical protein